LITLDDVKFFWEENLNEIMIMEVVITAHLYLPALWNTKDFVVTISWFELCDCAATLLSLNKHV
jgi:hypothetical protein